MLELTNEPPSLRIISDTRRAVRTNFKDGYKVSSILNMSILNEQFTAKSLRSNIRFLSKRSESKTVSDESSVESQVLRQKSFEKKFESKKEILDELRKTSVHHSLVDQFSAQKLAANFFIRKTNKQVDPSKAGLVEEGPAKLPKSRPFPKPSNPPIKNFVKKVAFVDIDNNLIPDQRIKLTQKKILHRSLPKNLTPIKRPTFLTSLNSFTDYSSQNYRESYIKSIYKYTFINQFREKKLVSISKGESPMKHRRTEASYDAIERSRGIVSGCQSLLENSHLNTYVNKKSKNLQIMFKKLTKKLQTDPDEDFEIHKLKLFLNE